MSLLHDEPSRALRIFPGRGAGKSTFTLYEDDGLSMRYRNGEYAQVECTLEWNGRAVRVRAIKRGKFALPYAALRVIAPPEDRRPIETSGDGVALSVA